MMVRIQVEYQLQLSRTLSHSDSRYITALCAKATGTQYSFRLASDMPLGPPCCDGRPSASTEAEAFSLQRSPCRGQMQKQISRIPPNIVSYVADVATTLLYIAL
jgi:hypothetical protein